MVAAATKISKRSELLQESVTRYAPTSRDSLLSDGMRAAAWERIGDKGA
jgi:hypothetical protein